MPSMKREWGIPGVVLSALALAPSLALAVAAGAAAALFGASVPLARLLLGNPGFPPEAPGLAAHPQPTLPMRANFW